MKLEALIKFLFIFTLHLTLSISSDSVWNSPSESDIMRAYESSLFQNAREEENSLSEEENLLPSQSTSGKKIERFNTPPKYISLLMEDMESNPPSLSSSIPSLSQEASGEKVLKIHDTTFTKPRDRLFYAWTPTETKGMNMNLHFAI